MPRIADDLNEMLNTLNQSGVSGPLTALLLLFVFGVIAFDLNHRVPAYPVIPPKRDPLMERIAYRPLQPSFSAASLAPFAALTNRITPFYTAHFQPPPPPQPKPVTTRKVGFTFRGFFQTAEGEKRAFVQMDEQLLVAPIGKKLAADLVVAEISYQSLLLTNSQSQSNLLRFNAKVVIDIPVP